MEILQLLTEIFPGLTALIQGLLDILTQIHADLAGLFGL